MTFLKKALYYYYTLRYIKPVQFIYQLKYRLKRVESLKKIALNAGDPIQLPVLPLPSKKVLEISDSYIKATVLNLSCNFEKKVNWGESIHGKLWNYHLQYADFLNQSDLSTDQKEDLIFDLYQWLISGKLAPEPYPASLRIMNVIRFLCGRNQIERQNELAGLVYSELHFLENRLEYHLLGNHLMENAFALLMGGTYFQNERWTNLANEIFSEQMPEQILKDGGHFERSPMYHLILLSRFLEAIYYLPQQSELHSLFRNTSKKMLGWIDQMSFRNGDLAHFNDSTDHQAYSKKQILQMAVECGISEYPSSTLGESGFRRFENENFELLVDAGGIKPDSQPGHAHADSLSFILYFDDKPVIVDPGVSTYETGERRNWERSTEAHNTVTFEQQNTADVWGKFRVARRPDVTILNESESEIDIHLKHRLQSGDDFEHQRTFACNQNIIDITDTINLTQAVEGRLHLHPTIKIQELSRNTVILRRGIKIKFQNIFQMQRFTYKCSNAFNLRTESAGILYKFEKNASLRIILPST